MNIISYLCASLGAALVGITFPELLVAQSAINQSEDTLHGPDHEHEVLEEIIGYKACPMPVLGRMWLDRSFADCKACVLVY